ncbi:MAG: OmpL47-type beta-barrel domain-containing protein [Bacillota bacterium]
MRKLFFRKFKFLALFLIISQFFYPIASILATSNSNMLPPSNLAAEKLTPDDVRLTWSSVYGATGYNVYEITEGQLILRDKVTSTSYNMNNLVEGSYRYVVSTLSSDGESGPSAPVSVDIVYPDMEAPATVTYTLQNVNNIALSWTASQYAEKYNLYQISAEGEKTLLTSVTGKTSYTINNSPEGTYTYAITAEHSLYGVSPLSTPVEVKVVYPKMQAPGNLTHSIANGNDLTLKWNSTTYATAYKVYQIVDGQPVLKSTVTGTTATFTNMPAGDYTYKVHSYSDRFGESVEGSTLPLTLSEVKMVAPSNFTYKIQNINDIVLTWGSVPYTTNYKIYEIIDGEKVLKSTVTGTSISYTKVPAGDHVYEVHSYSERFGESAEGSKVSLTVEKITMAAPSNFAYKIQNGNDIVLNWDSTANTTSYKVYQIIDGQKVLKSTVTGTTVTYTNMPADNYIYEVHSYSDSFGESAEGSKVTLTVDAITMAIPGNFSYKIQNGNDTVLSWESVPYATNYKVYQITTDGKKVLKSTVTGTTVTYINMAAGEYSYEVHSYSTRFGESEGDKLSFSLVHPTMKPPVNLKETIKNDTDFTLSWDLSDYAANYRVYQIVDGQKILKSTVSGTSVTYTNMPSGDYSYAVYTYSSRFGESAEGSKLTFTLKGKTMLAPANPTYTIANGNDIALKWSAAEYATSYKIYQVVDGEKVLKNTITGTAITYTNLPGGDYHYVIHSYSTLFGESEIGAELKINLVHPTMEAPGNLTYKIQNGNDIVLNWGAVDYANSYKLYELVDGQKVLKYTGVSLTTTFSKVPTGEHTYVVHSVSNRFGESPNGSKLTMTMNEYTMEAPGNLTHSITNVNTVTLKWDAVTYATKYKVYQIVDGERVLKNTLTGTSITYNNLAQGDYKYEVYSVSDRFGESPEGSQASFKIVFPLIEAPENATHKVQNGNDIVLNWEAVEYANSYKVYELIDGQQVLKTTVSSLSATFSNVSEGEHTYLIHALSTRFGESSEGSKLIVKLDFPTMGAPENLTHTFTNVNTLTMKWDPVPYATSYKVYQIIDGDRVLKSTVPGTTVSFANIPEGDFKYEVYSYSTRFGESPEGNKVSFTMIFPTMEAPENLTHSFTNGNDLTLKWNTVTYATSYKVYQIINGERVLKSTIAGTSLKFTNIPEGDNKYEVYSNSTRFGESPEGSQVSFEMVFPTMEAPENLTRSFTNGNDLTLKWNAVTYATNYKVYQIIDGERVLKSTVTGTSVTYVNIPEGDYKYEVHSYSSRFGESPEGRQTSFTMVFPTMEAPENLTHSFTNVNNLTLKWNPVTYATNYKVYQIIDGERVLKSTVTGTSVAYTNIPEGDYKYEVHSNSSRFGESPEGSKTSFTMIFPIMQAPGNATQSITNGNDITLKWNSATYATGYKVYRNIDGKQELVKTLTGTTTTFTNMPEGDYKYEVHSYSDRFGESPEGSLINFTLTWPVVQPPQLTKTIFNVNNITLTWPSVTWANEYRVYKITNDQRELIYKGTARSYNVYNLTEDTHSFEVTAYNTRFGESKPSNQVTETIVYPVMEPPTASLKLLSETSARIIWDFVTYANGYNIYEIIDGKPVLVAEKVNNLSYTINDLTYANHEYYVTSYSNSFGESKKSNTVLAKLILDTEAPVTTANAPTDWINQNQVVTLSATDNETGVAKTYYSLDGSEFVEGTSFEVNGEGIHKVSFYSIDKVDNKEKTQIIEVKIDKTAPVTSSDALNIWSKKDVTVNLTATDEKSGVAKTFYSINGSEYEEGTSFTIDKEGINEVSFYSLDQAGNTEKAQTIEVKVDKADPVTTSDALDLWSKKDVTVNLTATDEKSGVAKTFYSINSSEYVEGTSFTIDKEGINKVSFYSVDQAGNTEKAQTIEVKVDKADPVTTSDAPESWSTEDVTVNLTATDEQSGVTKTFYSINGSEYVEGTSFTLKEEGIHKVTFFSMDTAINIEKTKTIEVKIDKTAPVVNMDLNDEYKLGSNLQLLYTAEDNISNVEIENMIVSGPNETSGKEIEKGASLTLDKPGVYNVTVIATNGAGLTTKIEKQFVVYIPATIDVTAKVIKGNNGVFTVRVDLPEGFKSEDFDLDTAKINGVNALTSNKGYYNQAKNGQFKFERSDFTWTSSEITLMFRCYLDGYLVVGQKIVKVQN